MSCAVCTSEWRLSSSINSMGVGAQNDLGGYQSFAQKLTWKLPDQINRFFCPNKGDLQTKKKGLHSCWEGFFVQRSEYFSGQTCPNDMNLPKILTQNCPKFWRKIAQNIWNCPKFRHLTPTGGASAPRPPTSYAYDQHDYFYTIIIIASQLINLSTIIKDFYFVIEDKSYAEKSHNNRLRFLDLI